MGHASNSKIEIKEHEELQLECHVRNSKPAAKIIWFRGNVELNIGESLFSRPPAFNDLIRFLSDMNSIDKREDQVKEVPGTPKKAKRYDVWSRITLKPSNEDDYADYTCEARHEALPVDMPMRTSVQLSVLCK